MVIAIDFDGTCVAHEFPKVGKDIGAQKVLKRLVEEGHNLILWTMRNNCENNTGFSEEAPNVYNGNHLDDAVQWFEKNGIKLYGIQRNPTQDSWTKSPKCYAQLYIDDAALGAPLKSDTDVSARPFINWIVVERMLEAEGILKMTEV
jgi:hypothetical protein